MMRITNVLGNALIGAGILVLGFMALHLTRQVIVTPTPFTVDLDVPPNKLAARPEDAVANQPPNRPVTIEKEDELPPPPITRLIIPTLELEAPVATAPFLPDASGGTWSVPPDRVGHAEGTSEAGRSGNVVLFGHVSWKQQPGVFAELHRLQPGDPIDVFAESTAFRYRVVARGSVAPTDASPVDPTPRPALTLITCDGLWLPLAWDYSRRLVVRATLEAVP